MDYGFNIWLRVSEEKKEKIKDEIIRFLKKNNPDLLSFKATVQPIIQAEVIA